MKRLCVLLLLASCGPAPLTSEPIEGLPNSPRFKVELVKVYGDRLAYGGQRGVYVITDVETGREYVGVSGVGISELGSHQMGKARHQDER